MKKKKKRIESSKLITLKGEIKLEKGLDLQIPLSKQ